MAFEQRTFKDGEVTYKTPQWKKDLNTIENMVGPTNFNELDNQRNAQEDEVGFKHPTNGSYFMIRDNGDIEMFTAYGTGIKISSDNILQLFGDKVLQVAREPQFVSSPNYAIQNEVYESYPKTKGLSLDFIQRVNASGFDTYGMEEYK